MTSQGSGNLYQQANLAQQQQMLTAMLQGSGTGTPQNLLASNSPTNALLSQLFVPTSTDPLGLTAQMPSATVTASGHDFEDYFKVSSALLAIIGSYSQIPSSAAGAIFGHQGATINEIQARTDTKIRICDRLNESHGERQVFIRGSNQMNVAKAKDEILAKISGLGPEQRRGGYAQLANLLDASAFNKQL
ncbi:hypothetical protein Ciccas_007098 [Cichlidogyrus casuarinus]|uniref:K Homology domain-containing protein n=1 Tax=Cichlidogyrus casuarinus TaxID=1844966 RepID=A0ABD2Q4F0_9PLAT